MLCFERQAADNKYTDIVDWESLRGFLYFCIPSGITVAGNNLKERQVLTKPVALEENVGKSQDGIT